MSAYLCIVTNWSHVWMRHEKQQFLELCRCVFDMFIYIYILSRTGVMLHLWMRHEEQLSLDFCRCAIRHVHIYILSRTGVMLHISMRREEQLSLALSRRVIRHVHIHILSRTGVMLYVRTRHEELQSLDVSRCVIRHVHIYIYCHELESCYIYECAMSSSRLSTYLDWSKETPPPRGVFYLLCSLIKSRV